MTIPKLAPYSMDAFRASSGNNEYTRLLFIKKFITIKFKDDIGMSQYNNMICGIFVGLIQNGRLFITHFRFVKGRRNQNDSISADPAVKKREPVSKAVDLDETQIQFESNPGPSRQKL